MIENKSNRIDYLDIAKALGVIMVVWGHASGPLSTYMFQCHLPLFFIISGYLYNKNGGVKRYIIKKIETLYIPFVFFNTLSYSIQTVILNSSISKRDFLHYIFDIFRTYAKDGWYFGATWFLASLFIVSIIYKVVDLSIPEGKIKPFIQLSIFIVIGIIGFQINFSFNQSRTFILAMFFAGGAFVRKYKYYFVEIDSPYLAMICMALFMLIGKYGSANMGPNKYNYPIQYVFGAFLSAYAIIYFCRVIENNSYYLKKILISIGRNSLDIVLFQFVIFRIVVIIQMYFYDEPMNYTHIMEFYPYYNNEGVWWLIYTIAGIWGSIILGKILRQGPWGFILKKIHAL